MKKLLIITILFFAIINNLKGNNFFNITSSTSFTQDIRINYNPDVEVITSKEIQALGVENLPDLLNIFSGINLYSINASTSFIEVRGYSELVDCAPKIFIDGVETEDKFISKSYLYNLPVSLDDIDRIEIIKGESFLSDGYSSPAGIINIVTKSPEDLNANYFSLTKGSNDLKKFNFSLNRYLFDTYIKLNGEIRGIDEYSNSKETNKNKFINLSFTRYFNNNSLLFFKSSIAEEKGNFFDIFVFHFYNKWIGVPYLFYTDNLIKKSIYLNYKYPSLDISLLYKNDRSDIKPHMIREKNPKRATTSKTHFFKFNIKKFFKFKRNNITTGITLKYYKYNVFNNTPSTYENSLYFKDDIKISKNLNFNFNLKNLKSKNYNNFFSYFFSIDFHSKNKLKGIELSYSKNIKFPRSGYKYFHYSLNTSKIKEHYIPFTINTAHILNNKDLKPIKFYSSNLKLYYKQKKFNFVTTFFYNRITDPVTYSAEISFKINSTSLNLFPQNQRGYVIHGFEIESTYSLSEKIKFFASYYLQNIKVKTLKKQKDFIIPKYTIKSGFIYYSPTLQSSIFIKHRPQVNGLNKISSDDYTDVDINITKILKKKIDVSLYIKNMFNNIHKDTPFSFNLKREIQLKLKYKF